MAFQQQLKIVLIVLLFFILVIISARPGLDQEYGETGLLQTTPCPNDDNIIETCQRCAKKTKSPIVYPMCCRNEEDVFHWCSDYINYGSKP